MTPLIVSTAHLDLRSSYLLLKPSIILNNKHIQPEARAISGLRTTQLLDFALRRRRRPERRIAMA
jgi:hypothetical protein